MFITSDGVVYSGDMAVGDREATPAEIAARELLINPVRTPAELAAKATAWARAARLEFFKILDGLQVSAVVTGDTATAQAIEVAKQALRNITEAVDLSPFTTYEQMEQAYIFAYWQIRQTVPANVQSAFNSLVP